MSIQSITDSNLSNYALGIKFRDMAITANSGGRYEPKPIQTSITKEMIQDYQDEQNKPVIIKGRLYKYHPATTRIDPVYIDESKLENVLNDDDIQKLSNIQVATGEEYSTLEKEKIKLIDSIKNKKEAALPSIIGTSSPSSSIKRLSKPRPAQADSKCSTVETRTPSFWITEASLVSHTAKAVAGIIECSGVSTLTN